MTKLEEILRNPPTKPCQPTITAQQENPYFDVIDYPKWIEQIKGMIGDDIFLNGHIEKETDFWITVHCPNSGMIFDIQKKDVRQINKRMDEVVE